MMPYGSSSRDDGAFISDSDRLAHNFMLDLVFVEMFLVIRYNLVNLCIWPFLKLCVLRRADVEKKHCSVQLTPDCEITHLLLCVSLSESPFI